MHKERNKMKELNQKEMKKLGDVYDKFLEVGFSHEQAKRLIKSRWKHTESRVPYSIIDIQKRFKNYEQILKKYEISDDKIKEILSRGLIFSYTPVGVEDFLKYVEKTGVSVPVFLESFSSSEHGAEVLSFSPLKVKKNLDQMISNFSNYGLTAKDCCEMVIKYPYILKISPEKLVEKVRDVATMLENEGASIDDWIKAAKHTPDILTKNTKLFIKKTQEMVPFLSQYGIQPAEWVDAYVRFPRLLCKSTELLQCNINKYVEMFRENLFEFQQNPDANEQHLVRYLLASPQYICVSHDNVKLREKYSRFLIAQGKRPTSAIIYLTKSKILAKMTEKS